MRPVPKVMSVHFYGVLMESGVRRWDGAGRSGHAVYAESKSTQGMESMFSLSFGASVTHARVHLGVQQCRRRRRLTV